MVHCLPRGTVEGVLARKALRIGFVAALAACLTLAISVAGVFAYEDHVVQPGETLSGIADQYGFPVDTLIEVNGLASADAIYAGQVIRIPGRASAADEYSETPAPGPAPETQVVATASGLTHTVVAGETLSAIADQYGVAVDKWLALNGLANADAIFEGEVLQVPAGGSAPPPAASPTPPATVKPSGATHTVAPGETLSLIADLQGSPVADWVELNQLQSADAIYVGEILQVPAIASPAPAPVVTPVPRGVVASGLTHTVLQGETLSFIADHYAIPLEQWVALNHLLQADAIFVGQELAIPASAAPIPPSVVTHVVKEGETATTIAAAYGTTLEALLAANGITDPGSIRAGQRLNVPGAVCQPASKDQYRVALENAAAEFGLATAVLLGLAWHESGWQQCIVSGATAYGLTQVTPPTAQWAFDIGLSDAFDYQVNYVANARLGAAILGDHLVEANGDLRMALAAYYQGFRALYEIGMYDETKVYVEQVLAAIALFE